ncbi:hypothetical protein [Propioniciclava soli]|uniref:Uncharacterized protein n=1 Tax=Propioniciclava soli TaxID=2775081 RepID=A0ABZ3C876_9ACTN|nr:hypothetical protein [Propioniciclava soli]
MWTERRRGEDLLVCSECSAACVDAPVLARLLGEPAPAHRPPPEHGYPVHHPQQDAGHVARRGSPLFGPAWGLGPRRPDADAAGLLRGR